MFQFVVTDFECGFQVLGEGFGQAEPNGQFCVLTLSVENVGDTPRTYSYGNQELVDAQDRRITADFDGSFALDPDNVITDLNPGVGITTSVAFDVSAAASDADFVSAELHDSPLSFGAEVALR
jgi:hypothetical protein